MIRAILASYRRSHFEPNGWAFLSNPFYLARKGLYRLISENRHYVNGKTLDVGCGTQPYRELFTVETYVGLEIDSPQARIRKKADFFYDGKKFPFMDRSFDSVISNQVFEHVFNPDEFLEEIRRVLKPGGTLVMTVPFIWEEHEAPYDFGRYSSFGLKSILEKHSFEVVCYEKSVSGVPAIIQLFLASIFSKSFKRNKYLVLLFKVFVCAPLHVFAGLFKSRQEALFLDNFIVARSPSN